MYEAESAPEPGTWRPDDATAAWLDRITEERYGGDIGRCLAAVTKAARIAEETRRRGAATPDDLPVDPWQPLIETLRYRSPRR